MKRSFSNWLRQDIQYSHGPFSVFPALSDGCSKECRAAGYRVLRHLIVDADAGQSLQQVGLEWYIVRSVPNVDSFVAFIDIVTMRRSLARDNKHGVEKEQVIKLIRKLVDVNAYEAGGSRTFLSNSPRSLLSEGVVRALIAVAEYPDDPFRTVCLLTLIEIGMWSGCPCCVVLKP